VYLQLLFLFSEAKPDNKADAILVWAPNPELKDPKSIKKYLTGVLREYITL